MLVEVGIGNVLETEEALSFGSVDGFVVPVKEKAEFVSKPSAGLGAKGEGPFFSTSDWVDPLTSLFCSDGGAMEKGSLLLSLNEAKALGLAGAGVGLFVMGTEFETSFVASCAG